VNEIAAKKEDVKEILRHLKNDGFRVLMDLTAVDYPPITHVLYFMHNPDTLEKRKVRVPIERGEPLESVTDIFPGSNWYERELFDMFGVLFTGHPDLKRILMPDDWKGHPMRRDYALTEEPVEFKHGVKPKIPSKIIPDVKN